MGISELNQSRAALAALQDGVKVRTVRKQLNEFGIYVFQSAPKGKPLAIFLSMDKHESDDPCIKPVININRNMLKKVLSNEFVQL